MTQVKQLHRHLSKGGGRLDGPKSDAEVFDASPLKYLAEQEGV